MRKYATSWQELAAARDHSADMAARVQLIGQMDDRHKQYLAAGDRDALLRLARTYETFSPGMPKTAKRLRLEAAKMAERL